MTKTTASLAVPVLLCFLGLLIAVASGFSVASCRIPTTVVGQASSPCSTGTTTTRRKLPTSLFYAEADNEEEDDEDDDDEEELDEASLGDWRKFRASLIDGGLPGENNNGSTTSSKAKTKKKSVAVQNEALLEQQNEELANEYRTGVWAHKVGQPEVGGLLCRMPLEAQLYYGGEKGYWNEKLEIMLSMDGNSANSKEEKPDEENVDMDLITISKVDHWFTMAERMISRELEAITNSGKVNNGVLNPNDLDENERLLLDKYLQYKQTWQEICLLLSHNPESGCSEALILNRPITKSINKQLAKMLLEGSNGSGVGSFSYDFVDMVVQAFGKEAAVYMGGPHHQDEPASLIHGIPNLPGAREIAPGTNIYRGGWEAAVEGVIKGTYKPLDFRFFLGRQSYDPKEFPERGALLQKVQDGAYQPLACARSLALKQCLGLPKPLWHEVLELCGGELKALSSIELRKRIDLEL
ncbi:Uncharacterized ACR, COG1678 [Seminavis robusta]|uniref:Uncharacterized ACR, COG1678 n=1 Tax=Seminavis robusta TaxID=568900 RepID=A0A9N8EC22_9STRA|nr:Uncharacterized ACR, COG1678 [Seminavis robusta]|eukprot:Sro864_g212620.1 Uncharacterized ACR, COG1678 (468) ;mRNA; f:19768-21532